MLSSSHSFSPPLTRHRSPYPRSYNHSPKSQGGSVSKWTESRYTGHLITFRGVKPSLCIRRSAGHRSPSKPSPPHVIEKQHGDQHSKQLVYQRIVSIEHRAVSPRHLLPAYISQLGPFPIIPHPRSISRAQQSSRERRDSGCRTADSSRRCCEDPGHSGRHYW